MPIYSYRCNDCDEVTDAFRHMIDRDICEPCHCGGGTRKIFSKSHAYSDITPYFDENLECYIRGKQHRNVVMKERGVSEVFGKGWT